MLGLDNGASLRGGSLSYARRKPTAASEILSDDRFWLALSILFVIIPWAPYHLRALPHLNFVRDDIAKMQVDQKQWLSDLQKTTKKVQTLNQEGSTLEEENNALVFDLREHGDNIDTANNKYREGEEIEELYLKKIDSLQDSIQKHSKKAVEKE